MVKSRRAFTLVELLLVVAIISILIAMLLPSLRYARDNSAEAKCRANIGTVGRGTLAYAASNQGEFPANRFRPNPLAAQHVTWRSLVVKGAYVGDGELWVCPGPAPRALSEFGYNIHGSQCVDDVRKQNYAYNGAAFWRFSPNGAPDGSDGGANGRYGMPNGRSEMTLKNVRKPSVTFILLETQAIYPDLGDWCITWGSFGNNDFPIGYWHRRGANWAMADGSAQWMRVLDTALPECRWHNNAEPNNSHSDWPSLVLNTPHAK